MTVVADVDSDARVLGLEHRVSEIAGCKVKLLPESGMTVRNVMLAVFSEIAAVGIDDGGGVEINSRHLLFVNGDYDHHAMLLRDLLHEARGRSVRNALSQFVPARVLLRAKIRSVEELLQAENLRLFFRRLVDQLQVLVDHRLADLAEGAIGAKRVAGLNQGAANIAGHGVLPRVEEGNIAEWSGARLVRRGSGTASADEGVRGSTKMLSLTA